MSVFFALLSPNTGKNSDFAEKMWSFTFARTTTVLDDIIYNINNVRAKITAAQ